MEKDEKIIKKEEKNEKKKSSFRVTLLVVILICTAAFGGWLVGANTVNLMYKESKNKTNTNTQSKSQKDNTDNKSENENTSQSTESITEEIKALDLNKSLNTTNITYSDAKELENGNKLIGLRVKANGNNTKLEINFGEFGPYSTASTWAPDHIEEYEIRNIQGNIKEGYVGSMGQSAEGTTLFYLMEDGTVEYTRVFKKTYDDNGILHYYENVNYERNAEGKVISQYYESKGKINGVKDIIKLYTVNARAGSGYVTTIAATKDGSFYDLGYELEK